MSKQININLQYVKTYKNLKTLNRALSKKRDLIEGTRHFVYQCPESGRVTPVFIYDATVGFSQRYIWIGQFGWLVR